jgi:hypothetical protein
MKTFVEDELNFLFTRKDRVIDQINSCVQSGDRIPEYLVYEYNDLIDEIKLIYRDLEWSVIKLDDSIREIHCK